MVAAAEAWRVFYPDGHSKALKADRYFRKVIPPRARAPRYLPIDEKAPNCGRPRTAPER
jgi:hypothetical protein